MPEHWPGRLEPDHSLTFLDGGRVLVGGSPLTVLRFSEPIDLRTVRSPVVVDRLLDNGMAHPRPTEGPYTARDVTIVVPVFHDSSGLARTLASLRALPLADTPSHVLVVDDASPDARAIRRLVEQADDTRIGLVTRSANGGAGAARNTGLARVTTDLVGFLDAGCAVQSGWLEPLLAQFADPALALVAPRIISESPAGAPLTAETWRHRVARAIARYETARSPLDLGARPARIAPLTRVAYVPTACVIARTEHVREIGGFDETLRVGEDVDLVWRLHAHEPRRRVRLEPSSTVTHVPRVAPGSWLRRRFDYGTSAAPLAHRHPGALAPVTVSPWSVAAWGAGSLGHPLVGGVVAATSTLALARRLQSVPDGNRLALRLAGMGNFAAGRLLADALRRTWWPLAAAGVVVGPKSLRRTIIAAFVVPPTVQWVRDRPGIDPVSWLVLSTADDLAYGSGVWWSCIAHRTIAPLVPDLRAGRVRKHPH